MNQIIQFFIRSRDFLLFLLLFGLSISLVFKSNYYSQSAYLHSANAISGKLYGFSNYWAQYFNLRSQNELLSEENRTLRKELLQLQQQVSSLSHTDSLTFAHADTLRFKVLTANVIKNSFRLHKNYLTIDKGSNDGVKQDMDGRDIGTVVFPNAELKIFMTASEQVRAERRYNELQSKGDNTSFAEVLANIQHRDHIDTTRKESPLKKADDAIVIDNTHLTIDQQVEKILSLVNNK